MTEAKNKRLYPPSYGNLYYSMTVLREAIRRAVGVAASQILNNKPILMDAGCGTKRYKDIAIGAGLDYYAIIPARLAKRFGDPSSAFRLKPHWTRLRVDLPRKVA